ncbi:MAG: penicillin-binding protein 2 [Opitutaceae bacterium]|nr:penicillin-binding protein 2 [Opitutaceae bacterium]MBP9912393.1 penicillin-binding protein 2 [Opitutaceae bacterium]
MSKGFASNVRIFLLATVIFGCLAGIGVRLVFLHVIDREELVRYIEKTRRQIIVEHARRGDIIDTRGHILATSRSLIVLGVDPSALRKEDEAKWPRLAELIGVPLPKLEVILTTKFRPETVAVAPAEAGTAAKPAALVFDFGAAQVAAEKSAPAGDEPEVVEDDVADESGRRPIRWAKLSEGVEETVYDQIQTLGVKGVYGNRVYRRTYPHNALAAHVIGYVNKASEPAGGIESYADFYLRGQDGWREGERDGRRRELAQFRTREVQAIDGYHVMLSLDTVIQHMIEEELDGIAKKFNPAKATIIVSDARTGFILGLGNYPSFNLNTYNTAPLAAQRNVAITDQLDPGSTFKIVTAAGALNDGLVTPGTHFNCMLSSIEYKGKVRRFMPDDHHYDHDLSVAEIISHSSNVGAAQLGMKLGEQRLYDYARAFGFGEKSGFPFGGEINGLLNSPDKWTTPDITRIPAGYSISATPMQIHYAMATIASGGLLLRPQIIRQIRDASGEVVYRFDTASKRRVISETTATTMARMLQAVVQKGGTAVEGAIPGYEVAGKTGTAQKLIDGHYSKSRHIGSFVGFFPASRPQVVISVIVDDAQVSGGEAYGRVVGAPSFKHLGEQLIQYLDIKPVDYAAGARLVSLEGGRR